MRYFVNNIMYCYNLFLVHLTNDLPSKTVQTNQSQQQWTTKGMQWAELDRSRHQWTRTD